MSSIEEIRAAQIRRQGEKRSMLPMIAGTAAAFFAGGVLVMAWGVVPALIAKFASGGGAGTGKSAVVLASGAKRVGRAETAPVLRICVPREKLGIARDSKAAPADLYRLLKTGSMVSQLSAIGGLPQTAAAPLGLAILWGDVADCVYRQNGLALCDADNRALAIEAVNTFVRQLRISSMPRHDDEFSRVRARLNGGDRRKLEYEVQALHAIEDRVLSGLRYRVQEGRLLASDFGFSAAPEIKKALGGVTAERNACAEESH